jgi:enolase-phosphatase E1
MTSPTIAPPAIALSLPARPALLLWDIEGTTTPVTFVYDVLFPYARARISAFLADHWRAPALRADIDDLRAQAATDGAPLPPADAPDAAQLSALQAYCLSLMDADRKVTGLKSIQGKLWRDGYEQGDLRGDLYPDVPDALLRAQAAGVRVCIYSSGSVEAQRLLFAHSRFGDLTPMLSGYFDTTTGPKREPQSYAKIAAACGVQPEEALFLTDISAEADAAAAAGMPAAIMLRPGNAPQPAHPFPTLQSFSSLLP